MQVSSMSTKITSLTTLLKEITSTPHGPCAILLTGPDRIRVQRAESACVDALRGVVGKDITVQNIDCASLKSGLIDSVFVEAGTLSLFSATQLICFRRVHELSAADHKKFAENLKKLPSHLRIVLSGSKILASNPLSQYFKKAGLALEIQEINGPDLEQWVAKELKDNKIKEYEPQVVPLLIQAGESSPDLIVNLVEQLALYLDGAKATAQDIALLFAEKIQAGEFEFIDALARGNIREREYRLSKILRSGTSPFPLLGLVSRNIGNLFVLASLTAKKLNPAAVAAQSGIPPWLVKKQLPLTQKYTRQRFLSAFDAVLRADSTLKNRSLGPEIILSELSDKVSP